MTIGPSKEVLWLVPVRRIDIRESSERDQKRSTHEGIGLMYMRISIQHHSVASEFRDQSPKPATASDDQRESTDKHRNPRAI
tara:strand:- start:2164 stop:2409 length:246 start_codon:yes stop_codon:yes gene_type:complete